MGARFYDPQGGRFISPDPLGHSASEDLYSYANGDPVNYVDPWGLACQQGDGGVTGSPKFVFVPATDTHDPYWAWEVPPSPKPLVLPTWEDPPRQAPENNNAYKNWLSNAWNAAVDGGNRYANQLATNIASVGNALSGYAYNIGNALFNSGNYAIEATFEAAVAPITRGIAGTFQAVGEDYQRYASDPGGYMENAAAYFNSPEGLADAAFAIDSTLAGGLKPAGAGLPRVTVPGGGTVAELTQPYQGVITPPPEKAVHGRSMC